MTLRQTGWLVLLTAAYLFFELAFNARLLDVVGGNACSEEIHAIEVFGRSLSGIAVSLLVLQGLLVLRNRCGTPGWGMMTALCVLAAGIVYVSLERLTDYLVASSSPEFRHASQNIVLVQRALVEKKVRLDGLADDEAVYSRPEGKAFLALFPVMAVSVDRLEEKIRDAKLDLIRVQVSDQLGGPERYYNDYAKAVKQAAEQWKRYEAAGNSQGPDMETRQNKAWNDYLKDLRRHGWSQYTIPDRYRDRVLRKVQSKIPVPSDWDLADEEVFRVAVARRVDESARTGAANVRYQGKTIPTGLAWPAFFAHPVVQGDLREKFGLPKQVVLQPTYRSGDHFERDVFDPMVQATALRELRAYDAPAIDFANSGRYAERGREMARAAIVPPLALFFSLLGALTHLSKLLYLALKVVLQSLSPGRPWGRYAWIPPASVFVGIGVAFSQMNNDITKSRLYGYLQRQMAGEADSASPQILAKTIHIVAVGQGVSYPMNEWIRTDLLGGITFGYYPEALQHRRCDKKG